MLGLRPGLKDSVPYTLLPQYPSQGTRHTVTQAPPPCHLTRPFLYSGFPSIIRMFWILKERKHV